MTGLFIDIHDYIEFPEDWATKQSIDRLWHEQYMFIPSKMNEETKSLDPIRRIVKKKHTHRCIKL